MKETSLKKLQGYITVENIRGDIITTFKHKVDWAKFEKGIGFYVLDDIHDVRIWVSLEKKKCGGAE